MHHKPVVVLDPWGDFDLLRAQVAAWQERGFVSDHAAERVHWATDVDSALDQIAEALYTVRATAEADPLG
jgi:hypothetical protein